jgi:hypothetical protein
MLKIGQEFENVSPFLGPEDSLGLIEPDKFYLLPLSQINR